MATPRTAAHASAPGLRQLTTPRAAAVAGVLFAVLFGATIILIRLKMPEGVGDSTTWATTRAGSISIAAKLMPFAGITFLWFIGVVRDNLGQYEDRFFSSVLVGSGLLFLAMTFCSTAIAAGLLAMPGGASDAAARAAVSSFGTAMVASTCKTYAVRMAAVFMVSLATIWLRTGLMPRWLVGTSYAVAIGLLVAGEVSMWLTLAFPAWVLVVSVLILVRSGALDDHR
ncbi:hypothetical protein MMAD_44520 [Mycolicibacterium madagascariense]|uniref:DUF4386 domain-containing protein n=1 Tax=Mycolicibacterium madagascariense TaxID=212765 RepID=A0A7I7XLR6_9MYCO|nr:hypothetical protein [Mycolicibacterium madagascariense]BBZ30157.1 hypothetical protein MMAD_44520 [Mycolicibacterium madagascariense]